MPNSMHCLRVLIAFHRGRMKIMGPSCAALLLTSLVCEAHERRHHNFKRAVGLPAMVVVGHEVGHVVDDPLMY